MSAIVELIEKRVLTICNSAYRLQMRRPDGKIPLERELPTQ